MAGLPKASDFEKDIRDMQRIDKTRTGTDWTAETLTLEEKLTKISAMIKSLNEMTAMLDSRRTTTIESNHE